MFRAMALKEFREIRLIAIGVMILYGIGLFWRFTTLLTVFWGAHDGMPFIRDDFIGTLSFFAILLAVLMGLWQTFGESLRGTYPFLLHRSASFRWLIGMKLFVGMAVYAVVTGIPLLFYSIWAATPGNHAAPFEWSMTVPAWIVWLAITTLYLGAFLTGIMPGHWYGARFLPLAAATLMVYVTFGFNGAWWLGGIILVMDLWILVLIFFVAKSRDYS